MPRYLISFDDGSMDHIPEEDLPAVGEAAHKVVREAKAAGIWISSASASGPASSSRTEIDGSSLSLAATTAPALPAPMTT